MVTIYSRIIYHRLNSIEFSLYKIFLVPRHFPFFTLRHFNFVLLDNMIMKKSKAFKEIYQLHIKYFGHNFCFHGTIY